MGGADPSMVSGIMDKLMGGGGAPDRSNQLCAGILTAVANHLSSSPDSGGGGGDTDSPFDAKSPVSKSPSAKSSPKKSESKKTPSKSPSSKKASSK